MGFEAKRSPDAADRRVAHPRLGRHRPRAPMGFPRGRRFEGLHDHRFDVRIRDCSGGPHPGLVVDTVKPPLDKPVAPFADGRIGGPIPPRHGAVRRAVGTREHQARAEREGTIHSRPLRQAHQRASLVVRHDQRLLGASNVCHAPLDHRADVFSS